MCPRREFISEELQRKKVEVFGKDANNFAYAEGATTFQYVYIAQSGVGVHPPKCPQECA